MMRVTDKLNFANSNSTVMSGMNELRKLSAQITSGKKIQDSYEDASVYIDSTRLEYELKTLKQIQGATQSASELTKNTQKALDDIVSQLQNFKTKMTQAASDGNSQTSREAIAKELTRIRDTIVQLANTSVNGQYLFSGSQVAIKPFDSEGNYYGDKNNVNVVTGAGTESSYNIPGWDLFYKADSDYKKQITTNVSFADNRWDLSQEPDETKYLTGEDKWRQLIGQNYAADKALDKDKDFDDKTALDFPPSALYVQGKKPDGTSFKSAVLVGPDSKIDDVLNTIGTLYGNTTDNKVVEVSINNSGQIQITDLKQGNNQLDFHAVAFTPQTETTQDLKNLIQLANNNGLTMNDITNQALEQAMQNNNGNITQMPTTITFQPVDAQGAQILDVNGQPVTYTLNFSETDFIKSNMTDTQNNAANGADYDNVYFEQDGSKLTGNVSQVIKANNQYATDETKLSEVMAGTSLNGTTLNLNVSSKGGNTYEVSINLQNSEVSYQNNAGQTITFPITHTDPTTGNSGVVTPSNDITYRQINDIIGMFAADTMPNQTIVPNAGKVDAAGYDAIQQSIINSKSTVDVTMDYKGRIQISDKLSTGTNIKVALTDSASGVFPPPPLNNTAQVQQGANFSFSANNSLVIDEPNIDMVKDLDSMIESVLNGNMRGDAEGKDPRSVGMQGALERLDHLADHVRKQNSIAGTYQNELDDTNKRVSFLYVNVSEIKSGVIDSDYFSALSNFIQTQIAYNAALKASTTLSQLSLLNYM